MRIFLLLLLPAVCSASLLSLSSRLYSGSSTGNLSLRGGTDFDGKARDVVNSPLGALMRQKYEKSLGERRKPVASSVPTKIDGPLLASEVEQLRSMGVLKGRWVGAESQEEPESDFQDAHEAMWPDEWGGEEERGEVVSKGPGPVRLYLGNKYNHEILPTGRVKRETLERLKDDLNDDNAFFDVTIDGEPVVEEEPMKPADFESVRQHIVGVHEVEGIRDGDREGGMLGAMRLPGNVTPNIAKSWLSEAITSGGPPEAPPRSQVTPKGPEVGGAGVVPDVDGMGHESRERLEAEAALDAAIADNDEQGVEAAIQRLQAVGGDVDGA